MISTRGRYALRILVDLAENQRDGFVKLRDAAQRQEISEKYLESIMKDLVEGGLVEGLRGRGGGYRLSRPADEIRVREILLLTEGSLAPVACLEGSGKPCPRAASCRTLGLWQGLNRVVNEYLDSYTVQDLVRRDEDGFDYII